MRGLWTSSVWKCLRQSCLGLSLGLAAAAAPAGEVQWRPVADKKPATGFAVARPPAVTLGAPVATLEQPIPLAENDGGVRPAAFTSPSPPRVVRAKGDDLPRALPVGAPGEKISQAGPALPPPKPVPPPSPCDAPSPLCCDPCGCFGDVDGCCDGPGHCFWLSAEYLMWWVRGQRLPALVVTGVPDPAEPGTITSAEVIYGGGYVDDETRSGGRFRTGWWCNDEHTLGLEGSFFFLGQRAIDFRAGSGGVPLLGRPYLDADSGLEAFEGVAAPPGFFPDAPDGLIGTVAVNLTSRLWGFEANLRTNLWRGPCCNVDFLTGFRSLGLDEKLEILETPTVIGTPSTLFLVHDRFQTRNRFYGGQLGLDTQLLQKGRWSLDARTLVALGNVHQIVNIQGTTSRLVNGGAIEMAQGGLLAQRTNIGRYDRNRFAVLPEIGLNLSYQICDGLRLFVGYNFMYLSNVIRPGDQIDPVVSASLIPRIQNQTNANPTRPAFVFNDTDFWAHGVNFGLEFRY